jgi:hypothetical protein
MRMRPSERWSPDNIRVLERRSYIAPLGIRFWDPVRDAQVGESLSVFAQRDYAGADRHPAVETQSGLYAFAELPGASRPARFVVSVFDRLRRFVAAAFPVHLPLPRGVYPQAATSPPGQGPRGVLLFSSASRVAAPGIAAVRGQLWDVRRNQPGAHAWVDVRVDGGAVWRGLSDRTGAFAVLFPYPRVRVPIGHSPPASAMPLSSQRWTVRVTVGYDPLARVLPAAGGNVPLLRSILDQPAALVWPRRDRPPGAEIVADLAYGRELIVRTVGSSDVWIGRQGSPP